MFDAALRRVIDAPLDRLGASLARAGIRADTVTLTGFAIGMLAVPALWLQAYAVALACVILNRIADGLDGPIARHTGPSDLGGYLDIVGDFIFYSAVPFGFALADPGANGLAAAFVIFSFIGSGASFLAFAAIAAKRGLSTTAQGRKSLYYLGGLMEGAETIAFLVLICAVPSWFVPAAWIFGALCWISTAGRVASVWTTLKG